MRSSDDRTSYLTVWRRGGEPELRLPVGHLAGREVHAEILHPSPAPGAAAGSALWDGDGLRVSLPRTPAAVLVRLVACSPSGV